MEELELKFEILSGGLDAVERSAWFRGWQEPTKTESLVSVYFDTPKHVLSKQRGSLRIRHVDGHHVQTIKAVGALVGREEHEDEVAGDYPELSGARAKLLGARAKKWRKKKWRKSLAPVFETAVERESMRVEARQAVVQIAIDHGEIRAEGQTRALHEIELELESGNPEALAEVGAGLVEALPVLYEARTKAERGYALEHGADEAAGAEPLVLPADASAGQALRKIGFATLRHFSLNRAGVIARVPEANHQMRVGLRRLRAALSIFKELLSDPESVRLKAELKWLTDELGPARDFEVFARQTSELKAARERHGTEIGALCAVLEQRRGKEFERAAEAVAGERYRRLVNALALWLAGGAWATTDDALVRTCRERSVRVFARAELEARTRKIGKRLRKIEHLDERARHRLRIAVKKLRYASDFFASLFPSAKARRKSFVRELKALQGALGRLNDSALHARVAKQMTEGESLPSGDVPRRPVVLALGLVCGREDAAARDLYASIERARRRLARAPRFWR